jgi:predicted MFS family arabinose efflux permease
MSTEKAWDSDYEWKAVLILSMAFGLVGLDRFILPPLFPTIMKELRLTYQDLGNLVGILGVAWGCSAILMGGLSDRLGRKRILVPAVVMFSLLSVLSGAATALVGLLVIRAVMGFAEGAVAPTGVAVVVEASHPRRRGLNNGFFQCAISLFGLGIGPILATLLLTVTSWRAVFLIVGIPGLIVAAIIAYTVREPATIASLGSAGQSQPDSRQRAPLSRMFEHRNVAIGMLALLCAMTGVFVLGAIMPSYLVDYVKLTGPQMGVVTSAIGFGGALGQFGIPAASDFMGRRLATIASFILGVVFLYFFIHAPASVAVLFPLLFFTACGNFGALAILAGPIPAEAAPLGLVATVAGLVIGVGEIFGGGVAPSIAGAIAQHFGIQYTLYFALAGMALGILVSALLRETAPRRSALAPV